jgi:hypothetical protein
MKKIIRLTESDLIKLVKKVIIEEKKSINESVTVGDYTLSTEGGWIKDSKGNKMCVQVQAGFPIGTFAQGITALKQSSGGSLTIVPTGSKIGNIDVPKSEFTNLINTLKSGKTATMNKSGVTIKIGKGLVPWCKTEWKN